MSKSPSLILQRLRQAVQVARNSSRSFSGQSIQKVRNPDSLFICTDPFLGVSPNNKQEALNIAKTLQILAKKKGLQGVTFVQDDLIKFGKILQTGDGFAPKRLDERAHDLEEFATKANKNEVTILNEMINILEWNSGQRMRSYEDFVRIGKNFFHPSMRKILVTRIIVDELDLDDENASSLRVSIFKSPALAQIFFATNAAFDKIAFCFYPKHPLQLVFERFRQEGEICHVFSNFGACCEDILGRDHNGFGQNGDLGIGATSQDYIEHFGNPENKGSLVLATNAIHDPALKILSGVRSGGPSFLLKLKESSPDLFNFISMKAQMEILARAKNEGLGNTQAIFLEVVGPWRNISKEEALAQNFCDKILGFSSSPITLSFDDVDDPDQAAKKVDGISHLSDFGFYKGR